MQEVALKHIEQLIKALDMYGFKSANLRRDEQNDPTLKMRAHIFELTKNFDSGNAITCFIKYLIFADIRKFAVTITMESKSNSGSFYFSNYLREFYPAEYESIKPREATKDYGADTQLIEKIVQLFIHHLEQDLKPIINGEKWITTKDYIRDDY